MFELAPHGPDTLVGQGPHYPWGGLYGGQIVAQALRAGRSTVESAFAAHSIRAYFIRRGDHTEPVRYEVDRIRNGRTFVTRRVVARQAVGAILNAECSFQLPERTTEFQTVTMPEVPTPDELDETSWTDTFSRRFVPGDPSPNGRTMAWMKVDTELGSAESGSAELGSVEGGPELVPADQRENGFLHQCWLAYLSDDLPTDSVHAAHPVARNESEHFFGTSLDHTIWFHRPMRADRWHLHDFSCHHFVGARGLSIGHVFDLDGVHVATVAQEVLLRDRRDHR